MAADVVSGPLRPKTGSVEDGGLKVAVPELSAVAEGVLVSVAVEMLVLLVLVELEARLANPGLS